MSYYKVNHIDRLCGEVKIQGSKNAALPIIAAALLNRETTVIRNCPNISDVVNMVKILTQLGCEIVFKNNILEIDTTNADTYIITKEEVSEFRASIVLMGALLGRYGKVIISYPGGCRIGNRKIDVHLEVLRELGYVVKADENAVECSGQIKCDCNVRLRMRSVGATENGILASVISKGKVVKLSNVAKEPEIINLCEMLNRMGAVINGYGTDEIIIKGVEKLHTAILDVNSDRIVAGTYMAAVAAVGGRIVLSNVSGKYDEKIIDTLGKFGNKCEFYDKNIIVENSRGSKSIEDIEKDIIISTAVYPGFSTDMQSQLMSVMCCRGMKGIIIENIFENRLGTAHMLNKMGGNIKVINNRVAIVNAVEQLQGTEVEATDLRNGAALIIAGLVAKDYTIIRNGEYILRGYQSIEDDMRNLAADVSLCD
jgi:UDP-N-acetylglucosamine 1-carboxyvinyltransferase